MPIYKRCVVLPNNVKVSNTDYDVNAINIYCVFLRNDVKVNRAAYGRLIRMYRQYRSGIDVAPPELPELSSLSRPASELASSVKKKRKLKEGSESVPDTADAEAKAAQVASEQAPGPSSQGVKVKSDDSGHESKITTADAYSDFHNRLFALLLRYKSILGHGYQAATGPPVFNVLKQRLGVGMECFASPLNSHFDRFASAFVDVDGPFGSCGSFFR